MSFYSDAEKRVSMGKSMINLVRNKFKSDILDTEDIQEKVYDSMYDFFSHDVNSELCYPDEIENYINDWGWGFRVSPNIPIIRAFLKKWKVTPLLKGKKWIITLEETGKLECFHRDIESYRFDFEHDTWQSYEFFVKACPETEIKREDYEYTPFEESQEKMEKEEEERKNYLENCLDEELFAEIMRRYNEERSIDTDTIAEGLRLLFDEDGKLIPKREYNFDEPYHTPFLDYGGDEFHIDPVLRRKYSSKKEDI